MINTIQDKFETLNCIYGNTEATNLCSVCQSPLCDSCGYVDEDGNIYCNRCWEEKLEDETGICQRCGSQLEPVYENNGFEQPFYEIVGHKPCECRRD